MQRALVQRVVLVVALVYLITPLGYQVLGANVINDGIFCQTSRVQPNSIEFNQARNKIKWP